MTMNITEAIDTLESFLANFNRSNTEMTKALKPLLGDPESSLSDSAEWNFKTKRSKTVHMVVVTKDRDNTKGQEGYGLGVYSMKEGARIGQETTLAEFDDMTLKQVVSRVKLMMRKYKAIKPANRFIKNPAMHNIAKNLRPKK